MLSRVPRRLAPLAASSLTTAERQLGSFDSSWLRLRERYDHASRSQEAVQVFSGKLPHRPRLLELACGLGSGFRFVAPRLEGETEWTLLDIDPVVLEALPRVMMEGGLSVDEDKGGTLIIDGRHRVHRERVDLAAGPVELSGYDGVLCQSFLDLTSHSWLAELAARIAADRVPFMASLTVDGRVEWQPPHPCDDDVEGAFKRFQQTDHGFGPAAGVDAAKHFVTQLQTGGCTTHAFQADWVIEPSNVDMLHSMVEGHAEGAEQAGAGDAARVWREDRLKDISEGRLRLLVGHVDIVVSPPSTP